jgi:hypothetical protein
MRTRTHAYSLTAKHFFLHRKFLGNALKSKEVAADATMRAPPVTIQNNW